MKPDQDRLERFVVSARQITQRVSLLFLLTFAAGLLLLGRAESVLIERLALSISNGVAPILSAMTQSAGGVRRGLDTLRHYLFVFDENARLRAEIERLRAWQSAARRLEAENQDFRRLLRVQPEGAVSFVTGRTIGEASGPFVRSVLVDAGSGGGVQRNQAVLTADGLVGRVVSLGRHASRVLLITDINSRIPVLLERGREHGMLSGDNTGRPVLEFLPPKTRPQIGERVVTSGDGGIFPPGLPVGVVAQSSPAEVRVEPLVDFDRLDYVQIAHFDIALDVDSQTTTPVSPPLPPSAVPVANAEKSGPERVTGEKKGPGKSGLEKPMRETTARNGTKPMPAKPGHAAPIASAGRSIRAAPGRPNKLDPLAPDPRGDRPVRWAIP